MKKNVLFTFNNSEAADRFSTSTSKHWSKKSWNIPDSLSFSLISGLPFVAIKYNALSGFSFKYGGSPTLTIVLSFSNISSSDIFFFLALSPCAGRV
ncbi:hypothetical protein ALC57_05645 [Trachymyrmex cornetzi]|uniref:Uncharacterized protein n=1 Tax=Trachymyrmex cornetzi TaxID=471704 RepID=A0A151JAR0_9HYME|nr:hypothetical protein ALC57_05645 [Trachymyrmex cornetzi]